MDQPIKKASKNTIPNEAIGLNTGRLDEIDINTVTFKYLHSKHEAAIPTGSVGGCKTMRERILQLSLFPDIYDKRGHSKYPGNVDFGH